MNAAATGSRVLVLGATGYVGSRLVPALIAAGHDVVAASRHPDPGGHPWGGQVQWRRCDATDPRQVAEALPGVDALCYLVHSLDAPRFGERDRLAAATVADAVRGSDVRRVVYLSGLVPEADRALSPHLASRHEVETILGDAGTSALALRAGVIVGAGSTSFEIVRQLSSLLLVQPVPSWMNRLVQPVAVSDVVRALTETLADPTVTGSLDVGGPDVVTYPELLATFDRCAGLLRLRLPVPGAPSTVVGLGMAACSAAPPRTALALAHSLRDDMVCRPGRTWAPADSRPLLGLEDAIRAALADDGTTPESAWPADARWTRQTLPLLDGLPAPTTVRSAGLLTWQRLQAATGQARRLLARGQ